MIIQSIHIKEGLSERIIGFSDRVNLVHSDQNSKGKTTLLRFLLYSLGYNIPNTRKIKFDKCEVNTNLFCEPSGKISLLRYSNDFIVATIDGRKITFVLPAQINDLHKLIYGADNEDILSNILGAFYVDQEKGWTLLNRGIAIGSVHFNIEGLIRGLSGRDCKSLINEESRLSNELSKYRQMFSIAKYQESITQDSLASDNYNETSDAEMGQLLLQQKSLKAELSRIDQTLNDNKRFRRFVAEMKLLVQAPTGETIPVTEDNIVGLNDAIEFLIAKRKMVASELSSVARNIDSLGKTKSIEDGQLAFFQSESLLEIFDKKISSVPIRATAVNKEINRLEKAVKAIRQEITYKTKFNNSIVSSLYVNVVKYATELEIGDNTTIASTYLFTSNLKELSGAVLHKTVFAFRLAYIIEIEKALKIKLPIILDSPSGKEVDQSNIQLMVNILKRDFARNQIIIASIFKYDFDNINVIEIKDRLVE